MKINGIACWRHLDIYPFLFSKTPDRMENIKEGKEAAVIWGGKMDERESEEFSLLLSAVLGQLKVCLWISKFVWVFCGCQ